MYKINYMISYIQENRFSDSNVADALIRFYLRCYSNWFRLKYNTRQIDDLNPLLF